MIAYIKGVLDTKSDNFIIIDVQGIGYRIFMPPNSIKKLENIGNVVKVYTHYYVREDNISLYGFSSVEELRMFELLISVSGVGAKSAVTMLSEINPSNFALAVITDDISRLIEIPGVGKKTAARIILELKDKLKKEEANERIKGIDTLIKKDNNWEEAIMALQVLGYRKKETEKVLEKINIKDLKLEEIIKESLKYLSKN